MEDNVALTGSPYYADICLEVAEDRLQKMWFKTAKVRESLDNISRARLALALLIRDLHKVRIEKMHEDVRRKMLARRIRNRS